MEVGWMGLLKDCVEDLLTGRDRWGDPVRGLFLLPFPGIILVLERWFFPEALLAISSADLILGGTE
jgi:hypothetical protein